QNDLFVFQKELAESDEFSANLRVIDSEELQHRYDYAVDKENPSITHTVALQEGKFIRMDLSATNVIIASLPLKDCLTFPGIKDGTLFQKNVRQSLGLNNQVNKGIKNTIYNGGKDFFFFHNGITALCNKMIFDEPTKQITLKGLSVVNGCQSLNTILSCSEKTKELENAFIMFRFYEIPQRDRADKISISTNSQSSIKPRDLRSNDKRVLNIKRAFEQKYPQGYLKTKRGETLPANKDKNFELDLSDLAKYFISWHSQRPNIAYGETKLFDKYFEQLFRKDYQPEDALSLNSWMRLVWKRWAKENPLNLNESLLAMRAYAPYHQLYAVSICFSSLNNMPSGVPSPSLAFEKAKESALSDQIVDIAGSCLNSALEGAANEPQPNNRVFSPQNWIKTKTCLAGIRMAINQYLNMLPSMPGGKELLQRLRSELKMDANEFTERWAAD
ncbi:MAG: AIPR family protein, partial [Treponema sp.]|nr:AIPR family protein [Treponema sp.]